MSVASLSDALILLQIASGWEFDTRQHIPSTRDQTKMMENATIDMDENKNAKVIYQDINEWMAKEDERERTEGSKTKPSQPQPARKARKEIDLETLAAEKYAVDEIGDENWVGKLQRMIIPSPFFLSFAHRSSEYRDAHPMAGGGLTYAEAVADAPLPRFTCALVIFESSEPFGNKFIGSTSKTVSFSSKKLAKQYAAKKAVDWLIENKHMPSDGSIKFPKPIPPPQPKKIKSQSSGHPPATQGPTAPATGPSFTSQVPDLCYRLGFSVPRYRITQPIPDTPLWDAYADFGGDPRIDGKVGVVRGIYGQKKAKEACAELVVSFLKDIERQRSQNEEEEDRKRKRSPSSPEAERKTVKVDA